MKRWIAAVLAVVVCFTVTGCSGIAQRASEIFGVNAVVGSFYTYNIWFGMSGKMDGKLTYVNEDHVICKESLDGQKNCQLKYDITVEKGSASLVLRTDDGDTLITEGTSSGETDLMLKKGKNKLLLVGKEATVKLKLTMDEVKSTGSSPESDQIYFDKAAKIDTELSEEIAMDFIDGKLTHQEFENKLKEQKTLAAENATSALRNKELSDQELNEMIAVLNQYLNQEYSLVQEMLPVCKELKEAGNGLDVLNGLSERVKEINDIGTAYQLKIRETIKSIKSLQTKYSDRLPDNFLLKIVNEYDEGDHSDWMEQFYQ